jgi:type IV fimbrial biogenesis protein FimT
MRGGMQKRTDSAGHGPRGFSLTELLIVIALIGLTAALAAPSMRNMLSSSRTDGVIRAIRNDLQQARFTAIRTGHPASLRLQGDQYWVTKDTGTAAVAVSTVKREYMYVNWKGVSLSAKDNTGASVTAVTFDSRGFLKNLGSGATSITISAVKSPNTDSVNVNQIGRIYRAHAY